MYDIVIVGGGASGLFCACNINSGLNVMVLEGSKHLGSKLLLAGGGRCNFTNKYIDIEKNYVGENTKFLYSLFHKFSNNDMLKWLSDNGLKYKLEDNGKYYLFSDKSKDLLNKLVSIIIEKGINITNNCSVISIEKIDGGFEINTSQGFFRSKKVVISSGGKSFPQLGTRGFGYEIAHKYGGKVNPLYKGLCGIVTKENNENFAGSPLDVKLKVYDREKIIIEKSGTILFSHFGLTGPFIFDLVLIIGSYLSKKGIVDTEEYICDNLLLNLTFDSASLSRKLSKIIGNKNSLDYKIQGLRSWKEAKVTGGGISLREIGNDFQFKKCPGLYFIGEVLDITGLTGGYNLQLAWSSGYWCGKNLT